jgi:hypothetical protein
MEDLTAEQIIDYYDSLIAELKKEGADQDKENFKEIIKSLSTARALIEDLKATPQAGEAAAPPVEGEIAAPPVEGGTAAQEGL